MKILDYVSPYVCVYEDEKINFFFKIITLFCKSRNLNHFPSNSQVLYLYLKDINSYARTLAWG